MRSKNVGVVAMTMEDVMRPREQGEQVVSHVLEDAKEPAPDFDAMQRFISAANPSRVPHLAQDDTDR